MPLQDNVFSWFIKNVIAPNIENIDNPGFVITYFSDKGKQTFLRELFLEESLIERIENTIVQKYGDIGKKSLYSAGKKFGYEYSCLSNFPQLGPSNQKEIEDFGYFLVRFVSVLYAKSAESKVDLTNKKLEIAFENYIVCNKNGYGYLMTEGGIAGIWAYITNDRTVEGLQTSCQGRHDNKCTVICQPIDKFRDKKVFTEIDLKSVKYIQDYKSRNSIVKSQFAKNSLKNLIDSHFFSYSEGNLKYKDQRHFYCESNIIYVLESEVLKLEDGEKTLFDAAFQYGAELQKTYGGVEFQKFIPDYFSALGWGDIFVAKNGLQISSNHFPWTERSASSKFVILRGLFSGFISGCLNKKTTFDKFTINNADSLTVSFYAT